MNWAIKYCIIFPVILKIYTADGEICEAAGWGHADTSQEFGEGSSDILMEVDIPVIDYNVCKNNYDINNHDEGFKVYEGNICAGSNGKETCRVIKIGII